MKIKNKKIPIVSSNAHTHLFDIDSVEIMYGPWAMPKKKVKMYKDFLGRYEILRVGIGIFHRHKVGQWVGPQPVIQLKNEHHVFDSPPLGKKKHEKAHERTATT